MNKLFYTILSTTFLVAISLSSISYAQSTGGNLNYPIRIGIVNTKKCLENSKLGKAEQANFEKMKSQMESVLQTKERELEEVENKLNDDDYMDGISDEVANELRNKKRNIKKDGMGLQSQYMQTLQQANMKIIQKLSDAISKASKQVAQDPSNNLNLIFTDDATTFYAPDIDVTDKIVARMNSIYDQEQTSKNNK